MAATLGGGRGSGPHHAGIATVAASHCVPAGAVAATRGVAAANSASDDLSPPLRLFVAAMRCSPLYGCSASACLSLLVTGTAAAALWVAACVGRVRLASSPPYIAAAVGDHCAGSET